MHLNVGRVVPDRDFDRTGVALPDWARSSRAARARGRWIRITAVGLFFVASVCGMHRAFAHAVVGMRVFPATLTFDDPGVADELPLVFDSIRTPGGVDDILSASYAKTLTRKFGFVLGTDYEQVIPGSGPAMRGLDDWSFAVDYQLYKVASTESIGMLQMAGTFGGSGSRAIGAPYSVYTPEFAFGQGMGFLPFSLRYWTPFAVSGAISENIPSNSAMAPRVLNWDFSLQYSIPYLQDFVHDEGIVAPFNNMVPIVEIPMQTCLDRDCPVRTTGYIDPGLIWIGHYLQWGVEFELPINSATGDHPGILLGVDFYFDDLFPKSLGAPLWSAGS